MWTCVRPCLHEMRLRKGCAMLTRRTFLNAGTALLSFVTMGLMAGCSSRGEADVRDGSMSVRGQTASAGNVAAANGTTLVAYYSWSGNTAQVAEYIHRAVGGDLFEIVPVDAYPAASDDHTEIEDIVQREQDEGYLPPIAALPENWDSYDAVILGYPIWWYDMPQVVKTFLDSCDCSGKTVLTFCTSGGSSLSTSMDSLTELCPGATLVEGPTLSERDIEGELGQVDTWLAELGF